MACSSTKRRSRSPASAPGASRARWIHGFPCCCASSIVLLDPPVRVLARLRITVPSESRTFHSVRCTYATPGVSLNRYRLGIVPSSAFRPRGHHPPCGSSCAIAQSRAARSAPVCPPDTILRSPAFTGFAAGYATRQPAEPGGGEATGNTLAPRPSYLARAIGPHSKNREEKHHETSTIHVAHGAHAE